MQKAPPKKVGAPKDTGVNTSAKVPPIKGKRFCKKKVLHSPKRLKKGGPVNTWRLVGEKKIWERFQKVNQKAGRFMGF